MKKASLLDTHRRVVALCVLSLLLHVLVIEWIASRSAPPPHSVPLAPGLVITTRLRGPAAPPAAAAPAAPPAAARAAAPDPVKPKAPAERDPAPPAVPAAADAPAAAASAGDAGRDEEEPVQMPGRYRVQLPPGAVLTFDVSRSQAGQPGVPAGSAQLSWQTTGNQYRLQMDGPAATLAGQPATLSSEGGVGDAGIEPQSATETRADGAALVTRSYPVRAGSQDRASLLMQLAGIGLAQPDQVKDVIRIVVGAASEAGVAQFRVVGKEEIPSALGTLGTWHLAQVARPGQARLEVWLAPAHNWYPVQLRATAPDGTVSTQLVTRIEMLE